MFIFVCWRLFSFPGVLPLGSRCDWCHWIRSTTSLRWWCVCVFQQEGNIWCRISAPVEDMIAFLQNVCPFFWCGKPVSAVGSETLNRKGNDQHFLLFWQTSVPFYSLGQCHTHRVRAVDPSHGNTPSSSPTTGSLQQPLQSTLKTKVAVGHGTEQKQKHVKVTNSNVNYTKFPTAPRSEIPSAHPTVAQLLKVTYYNVTFVKKIYIYIQRTRGRSRAFWLWRNHKIVQDSSRLFWFILGSKLFKTVI